jgi:hypothetical protein
MLLAGHRLQDAQCSALAKNTEGLLAGQTQQAVIVRQALQALAILRRVGTSHAMFSVFALPLLSVVT